MLEAEDIDDDYFTPVPSTPLASIFGDPQNRNTPTPSENESLKYTPPKKQVSQDTSVVTQIVDTKPAEEAKVNECMIACAVTAYEWVDNNYSPRGKLGFAILKIGKTKTYSIVLYNSNKTNLSTATVTSKLSIMMKENNYISYYDNLSKYWSIYGNKEEINKIIEILKPLGVDIKRTLTTDQTLPEPMNTENEESIITVMENKESDTDSSVNRKTKASILNRMANMGHSVLPAGPFAGKSSESSDSDEFAHLPPKVKPKAAIIEKKRADTFTTDSIKMPVNKIDQPSTSTHLFNSTSFGVGNGPLVPVTNTSFMSAYGNNNEMSLFMTEQRMNNSELRINMNRTTDKLDQVLEKFNALERSNEDKRTNFQMELMQKLLCEYENKIKKYEQILASVKTLNNTILHSENSSELGSYLKQISNLQDVIEGKDMMKQVEQNKLVKQVADLKEELSVKTTELEKMSKELEECQKRKEDQSIENSVKDIMNDVFHSISISFENNESYDGESVKRVVASIIKKNTIQTLN